MSMSSSRREFHEHRRGPQAKDPRVALLAAGEASSHNSKGLYQKDLYNGAGWKPRC
jgi:hypothetical protein